MLCRLEIWAVNAAQGKTQHGPGNVGPDYCNVWSLWFNKDKKFHLQNSFYSNIWDSLCCFFQQSLWFRLWSMLPCKSLANSCGFSWVQLAHSKCKWTNHFDLDPLKNLDTWVQLQWESGNFDIGHALILLGTILLSPITEIPWEQWGKPQSQTTQIKREVLYDCNGSKVTPKWSLSRGSFIQRGLHTT